MAFMDVAKLETSYIDEVSTIKHSTTTLIGMLRVPEGKNIVSFKHRNDNGCQSNTYSVFVFGSVVGNFLKKICSRIQGR
jgi:hypothetical protein